VHRPAHASSGASPFSQYRGSAHSRGYDRTWEKLRRAFLAAHPLCLFHQERGEVVEATQVDHIQTIERRPDLRLEWTNLRPLCASCHSERTARDQAEAARLERMRGGR
jgi:5-methylcytosine-specific restriction endonuclease McrA